MSNKDENNLKNFLHNLSTGKKIVYILLLLYIIGRIGYFAYQWFIG